MAEFAGIDHAALTVTDLDVSQHFYVEVLGFLPVLDVGTGRVCVHPGTGFTLSLWRHDGARGGSFSELTTGLDHLGLTAGSRAELEEWQGRFEDLGVTHSPIQDLALGHHLSFRDPDGIALELYVPTDLMRQALAVMASGEATPGVVAAFVAENLDPSYVVR